MSTVYMGSLDFEEKGAQPVTISSKDYKHQIIILLTVDGRKPLPPQMINGGPTVDFPDKFNVTHRESHWSNEISMLEFYKKIVIPYMDKMNKKSKDGR